MLFPFRKPEVRLLKNTAAGVIFSVKSGIGFLRQCVIYDPLSHGLIHSLCWHGCPVNTFLVRGWLPYLCGICLQRFCGG